MDTDRDPICYGSGSDVYGNGEVAAVTVTPPGESGSTTYYRYFVKEVSSAWVMTPFVTTTMDPQDRVTKNVLNTDGSVSEVWEDEGETTLSFVKTRSYTYYSDDPEIRDLGRIHEETVYDVANVGASVDQVTHYEYDYTGDEVVTVRDTSGNLVSKVDYNKLVQTMWDQDRRGALEGKRTDYAYDYRGNLLTTTYPLVDSRTNPLIVGDAARMVTENHYLDCCNQLEWARDEEGNYTYYDYDGMGRAIKTWTGIQQPAPGQSKAGDMVVYEYDGPFGALSSVTTYKDASTGRETSYSYDNAGRLIKVTDPTVNPLDDHTHPDGDTVYNEYYQYDQYGRVEAKLVGLVSGTTITAGKVTAYHYDVYGRVDKVRYDYSASSWPIATVTIADLPAPPGVPGSDAASVQYGYDNPTSLVVWARERIDSATVTSYYAYDLQGRLTDYTPAVPSGYGTIKYTWNTLGQKTSMTVPLGVANQARKIDYFYDNTGKMVGLDVSSATVTADGHVLETGTAGETQFYYDDNQNRVKMVTTDNATFDGTYYYVYDPTASIPAVVYEQGPSHIVSEVELGKRCLNVREPNGALVSRQRYSGDTATFIDERRYHFDGLGNTVALSNGSGTITDRYSYDAWGNVTPDVNNVTTDNPYQFVGELGYYTHYQQPSFGLLQLGVRYYDPASGRFTQVDPLKDGANYYAYGAGDPLTATDPSGLYTLGDKTDVNECAKSIKDGADEIRKKLLQSGNLSKMCKRLLARWGVLKCLKDALVADNGGPLIIGEFTPQQRIDYPNATGICEGTDPHNLRFECAKRKPTATLIFHEMVHYCRHNPDPKDKDPGHQFHDDQQCMDRGDCFHGLPKGEDRSDEVKKGKFSCLYFPRGDYCQGQWDLSARDPKDRAIHEEIISCSIVHECGF